MELNIFAALHDMSNRLISVAALSGCICVVLGAFGAHALKTRLMPETLAVFETAVRYQFYHSLALFLTGMLAVRDESNPVRYAGYLFITGILLFSGSLYLMTASYLFSAAPWKWMGAITPLGGLAFAGGWLCLFISTLTKKA